jgi:hypothetical protein
VGRGERGGRERERERERELGIRTLEFSKSPSGCGIRGGRGTKNRKELVFLQLLL